VLPAAWPPAAPFQLGEAWAAAGNRIGYLVPAALHVLDRPGVTTLIAYFVASQPAFAPRLEAELELELALIGDGEHVGYDDLQGSGRVDLGYCGQDFTPCRWWIIVGGGAFWWCGRRRSHV